MTGTKPSPRPQVGDLIWLTDIHKELVHICTVQDGRIKRLEVSFG